MTDTETMNERTHRSIVYILLSGFILFLASRFLGPYLFENDWSLRQWLHLPDWYWIVWLPVTVGVGLWLTRRPTALEAIVETKPRRIIAGTVVVLLLVVLQFDSFVFASGNLRIAQLAQTEQVILRWFEFGAVGLTALFYMVTAPVSSMIEAPTEAMALNRAAFWSWQLLSWVCGAASLVAAWLIAGRLGEQLWRRLLLAVILFFGPHALVLFGFAGTPPVFVAFTLWVFYFALLAMQRRTYLWHTWSMLVLGMIFHISLAALLPAVLYLTLARSFRVNRPLGWPAVVAVLAGAALLVGTYAYVRANPEFVREILFLRGKRPFVDYGLFSLRHLGDLLQILLMVFPAAFTAKYLVARGFLRKQLSMVQVTAMLMALGGVVLVWITDPDMTVVLDFPLLAAFLAPLSVLAATLVASEESPAPRVPSATGLLAALSVLILFSYLPLHTRIQWIDGVAANYLESNRAYYYQAGLAFRDAYFYLETGEKPRANEWEQETRRESNVMYLMEGSQGLVTSGELSAAINSLERLSAEFPFLAEPRLAIAEIEMGRGRYSDAQVEVDSLMLLFPYNPEVRILDYRLAQARGQVLTAGEKIDRAMELFPGNPQIMIDKVRNLVLSGNVEEADAIIRRVVTEYPDFSEGWLVEARLAARLGALDRAIAAYERFIDMEPRDPDIGQIRKRLNELVLQKRGQVPKD